MRADFNTHTLRPTTRTLAAGLCRPTANPSNLMFVKVRQRAWWVRRVAVQVLISTCCFVQRFQVRPSIKEPLDNFFVRRMMQSRRLQHLIRSCS